MKIEPVSRISSVPFGLNVKIDSKLLKSASKTDYDVLVDIQRELRGIGLDRDVFFKAVEGPNKTIVNVAHMDDNMSLQRLYPTDNKKPFAMEDFIKYLREKVGWYEDQLKMDRELEAAFGK
ncbi:MAG: hypothetical protein IKR34_05430 [Candidatus Gastranaerophilales bacterium]|nr:hypothetical protein [Candidatus Gastranaerophilales bacterium]